jgi:hypothetical protein
MLIVTMDTARVLATVDNMIGQLAAAPRKMQDEMIAWQKDDMRRARPNVAMPDEHTVATVIWPRSRLPETKSRRRRRPALPSGKRSLLRSTRPILRPELFDRLVERMRLLLAAIKWTTK